MKNILESIRKGGDGIIVSGMHTGIIQSMLDFDYLSHKSAPSVLGIVTGNRKSQKFFFGSGEVLIPCFASFDVVPFSLDSRVSWLLNVQSGRRAYESTAAFFARFPDAIGASIFAENVPENHAVALIERFGKDKIIAGPASVGILVPGALKLGAIGGIGASQLAQGKLMTPGSVAVVSTSGGMTNELITAVVAAGKRISFSLAIGGDRFPISSLSDVLLLAEADTQTKAIVYFGELGGVDEYEIVSLLNSGKLTKPVLAYIAGIIDEAFDAHMQFGHAKALVARADESARAKRSALRAAGALAPETFTQFLTEMKALPSGAISDTVVSMSGIENRTKSILSTRQIVDLENVPAFVKGGKLLKQKENTFASAALQALLGREVSAITAAFVENIFELLIDHGGNVSGAVNTMVTARAGRDMATSISTGLLTVGPRFGGAVNEAARTWYEGVISGMTPAAFVKEKNAAGVLLAGIGHRKYRVGIPDPRVEALSGFAALLKKHPHYDFARAIEAITVAKSGSLILNVDGVMAGLLLDILTECEEMTQTELQEIIDIEFFNALFIIPRTVGFIAHFMEQKRNDEGLFRLPDELLFVQKSEKSQPETPATKLKKTAPRK